MAEATVETIVLSEPGRSRHLPLRGVVGSAPFTYTDRDLRAATPADVSITRELSRQRFVSVDEAGLGRLDRRYTVRFDVPVITDLPARPQQSRPTPPRAKRKTARK
ncbi:hypothetical protein [Curtobacterium sp. MCSS17_016]|uniref:hypothetical protein n=1 Tax=Curtobacterium sp. MCSS17_016 TaxID=2175644 RepID=UPI000DA8E2C2|nr:hypothetical protein [Curtobacterium sp. MCSS17_016]WIE80871.1 hypothetical protein DEJ19_020355 [Curtobacterium sp. MCSS17_016]